MFIYYDITDVLHYARDHSTLSGIQRSSLTVLSHLVNRHGADRVRLLAYHPVTNRFESHSSVYFSGPFEFDQQCFCREFALNRSALSARLTRLFSRSPAETVEFTPSDIVYLGGATWGLRPYLELLARRRLTDGFALVHFIHDLIPLRAPEHVVADLPQRFADWLAFLSRNVDGFVVNSLATRADLSKWLEQEEVDIDTKIVRLAHQFGRHPRVSTANPEARASFQGVGTRVLNNALRPYVLCVGTMESRKNNRRLAIVWQRIQGRLGDTTPRLIFAGNPGWLVDDFKHFLDETNHLSGCISVIERPTDQELHYLYRNCLFSVFPSHKEGWGLPVGESLWLGRPVVCSNVSAMPEVGGELADYVDPVSLESIEAAVLRLITDEAYRDTRTTQIDAATLRSWEDVAADLWVAMTSLRPTAFRPCHSREDAMHLYR